MLPTRKHPTNRAEYVNKCKNEVSRHDKSHRVSRNAEKKNDHHDHRTTRYYHRTTYNRHRTHFKFHHTPESHRSSPKPQMHTESFVCASKPSSHTRKTTNPKFPYIPKSTLQVSQRPTNRGFYAPKQAFQVSISPEKHPEVSQMPKAEVSTHAKRPLQVPPRQKGAKVSLYP